MSEIEGAIRGPLSEVGGVLVRREAWHFALLLQV